MADRKAISQLARRELARRNYADYVEYVHNGQYVHAAHTRLICAKLDEIITGRDKRLIVCLPPRHSKSMTITETFPSYFLGKNPNKQVIATAYGDDLAIRFGRRNRDKAIEFGQEIFGTIVSPAKSAAAMWEFSNGTGGMRSAPILSGITGMGADLLIIDDPIKNDADASSQTIRDRIWSEYQATLRTRLHPGGSIVVILTRWHEDDLAGRLIKNSGEDWDVISLPAECENENDLLGRKIGEPLWPKRGYDHDWMEQTKKEVGSRVWAALYQQRPAPAEGNIIKRSWWQYYDKLPTQFDRIIQSWDCTFKETKEGSYVVGQVWGKIGANSYLIDQFRERTDFTGTQKAIINMTKKHPRSANKYIEEAANGAAIISTLKQSVAGIIPVKPNGSKEARVHAVTPYIEAGNVFLPSSDIAPWIDDFVLECTTFPNGLSDDQTDGMSQALNQLYRPNAIEVFK